MARSAYDQPDPDDLEDAEEAAVVAAAQEDLTAPSESQLAFIRQGGQLITNVNHDLESDPTGTLARGQSPESVRGRVRIVDSFSADGISEFDLAIDGKLDPDWVAVGEKYRAVAEGLPITGPARNDLAAKMFAEVAARKRERAKAAEAARPKPRPPFQPATAKASADATAVDERDPVVVTVNLGAGLGRLNVAYRDVQISGRAFVLVSDPPVPGGFTWTPPEPDPDAVDPQAIEFGVPGLPTPVRAFPLGLSYTYEGRLHFVLLIDRPSE